VRLLLCDDHQLFLEAMAPALTAHGHEVVGTATALEGVLDAVARSAPDACLLDLRFPEGTSIQVMRQVREAHPRTQVLMLSATEDPRDVAAALDAGANGFVRKDSPLDAVLSALRRLQAGELAVDPELLRAALRVPHAALSREPEVLKHLTQRERDVLDRLVSGETTAEIAASLGIARSTARTHVQSVLVKLHVHSRLQAAALMRSLGEGEAHSRGGTGHGDYGS
jgi:two-component system nitrate/nitrite response regulator NarL